MALDRDEDGARDRDELDASTDPDNAGSIVGACNDGIDNDGDGSIDLGDSGCKDTAWTIENPACSDGLDNDNDGAVDLADPNCGTTYQNRESNKSCGLLGLEPFAILGLARDLRRRRRRS